MAAMAVLLYPLVAAEVGAAGAVPGQQPMASLGLQQRPQRQDRTAAREKVVQVVLAVLELQPSGTQVALERISVAVLVPEVVALVVQGMVSGLMVVQAGLLEIMVRVAEPERVVGDGSLALAQLLAGQAALVRRA